MTTAFNDGPALSALPTHFRQIALWFLIVIGVGYTAGLIMVAHTTSLSRKGVEERYRGNQDTTAAAIAAQPASGAMGDSTQLDSAHAPDAAASEPELKFEKPFEEMLNITHTHLLAMVAFLVPVACIFALTRRVSRRWKSVLIIEPFVALLVSFSAMWLMRYVHPAFSYLLMASSGSFAVCFYAMVILSLRELVGRGHTSAKPAHEG